VDEIKLSCIDDYKLFIPENLPENFTSHDYSKLTKLRVSDSQKALLVLTELGIVSRVGYRGRYLLYAVP